MKKFLLGVGGGIILTCALFSVTAVVKQHRLIKAERSATTAAAAFEDAAAQRPVR